MLLESGYNKDKTQFIYDGFANGFDIHYDGPLNNITRESPNLKIRVGSKEELWRKVMNEVKLKRFAGPFTKEQLPFENYIQSPIGLVPKDKGTKTRLIFHLSYPRDGDSINSGIDPGLCSVQYPDFTDAVRLCYAAGVNCSVAKSDMSSAFRQAPLKRDCWRLLVMKLENPETKEILYFIDKCLPFGSSISCAIFQKISDAISHIVHHKSGKININYLDDYLFVSWLKQECNDQVHIFFSSGFRKDSLGY